MKIRPGPVEKIFWLLVLLLLVILFLVQLVLSFPAARYLLAPVERLEGVPLF